MGDDLRALADRVEREEPSRELDCLIERAISPDRSVLFDPGSVAHDGDKRRRRPPKYGPLRNFPLDGWDDYEAIAASIGAERYTSSRDAAAMLMPEGWMLFYLEQYPDDCAVESRRGVVRFGVAKGRILAESEASGHHAEARARCAAALRAHIVAAVIGQP